MAKFSVDVKAFIKVDVEAENEDEARRIADSFVENLSPADGYVGGYNQGLALAGETARIGDAWDFSVDGYSDVERLCEECGEPFDDQSFKGKLCLYCEPGPEEPPLDTPSLDTSFHDHEMNV